MNASLNDRAGRSSIVIRAFASIPKPKRRIPHTLKAWQDGVLSPEDYSAVLPSVSEKPL